MICLVNPSLVEMDMNSISGYLHRMRITLVWVWAPSPVAELQGESHPCCDVGAPAGGCGFKEVVKYSTASVWGEQCGITASVFVYILDTCSWHMEKECLCDHKIKRAKVRKCWMWIFPPSWMYPLCFSLFPINSCILLCMRCLMKFQRELIQYLLHFGLWEQREGILQQSSLV